MSWYRIAQGPAEKATFILGELSYYDCMFVTKKWTGFLESFVSYLDRIHNVLSEFMQVEEIEKKAKFGLKFYLNSNNIKKYIKTCFKVMNEVSEFKKKFDTMNVQSLGVQGILGLLNESASFYNTALGLYLLSQPEYTSKVNDHFLLELKKYIPAPNLQQVFTQLSESSIASCLEKERRDWLQHVVISNETRALSKDQLKHEIAKHIVKYKYYAASSEFGLWDKKHYLKLLKDDTSKNLNVLEKELLKITDKKKSIENLKKKLTRKYRIPADLYRQINDVSQLGSLRVDLRVLGWSFFHYLTPQFLEVSARLLGVNIKDMYNFTYKEYIELLSGDLRVTDEHKRRRGKNALIIISPQNGYEVFWGDEADNKYRREIAEEVQQTDKFQGQVANGKGVVRGEVFMFQWGAKDFNERIYNFPENFILVAGQTRPQLMPAIRKAKGIITDEGGMLCHAAIVSRELGKPCIIGTKIATQVLRDGDEVEMNLDVGIIKVLSSSSTVPS